LARGLLRIRDLVEKTQAENAPSNLAITGRYVLPSSIFDCLSEPNPRGKRNSVPMHAQPGEGAGPMAYIYEGISYDAGDKLGFLKATVELACKTRARQRFPAPT